MRVFDVVTGFQAAWEKILKRAGISNFRWHDLRHRFASRLVQHGVPLNTVRDLLGHSTVGMSLRYAHLAPDQRREAVARLNEPLLTLTMRREREGSPAVSRRFRRGQRKRSFAQALLANQNCGSSYERTHFLSSA
jgi:integrase-like protein